MRAAPILLALLLNAPAAAHPEEVLDLAPLPDILPQLAACDPLGVPPLDCVREQLQDLCEHLHNCNAVCDSFVPGFGAIVLPSYDPVHRQVTGTMWAVDTSVGETIVGVITYHIRVDLSFNVSC